MSNQRFSQILAVFFAVLITLSTVGSTVFVGAAGAATSQQTQNSIPTDSTTESLSEPSESTEPSDTSSTTPSDTQQSISDGDAQQQVGDYEPVSVTTTLNGADVEKFSAREVGNGRYVLSGVLDANPPEPIAPVGHPARLRLNVFDENDDRVATDLLQVFLEAGSVRPHQLNVSGTIYDLNKTHPSNTNPDAMHFTMHDYDGDGTEERVVVNGSGGVVRDVDNNPIVDTNTNQDLKAQAVRDPYTSQFQFIVELGDTQTYDFQLNFSASDGPEIKPIQVGQISPTEAASETSISSKHQVLKNTRWRNGSDVTFVTSYKSTDQQSEQEVYESLALPTRGEYRADSRSPRGNVRGFAHASSNNGEFAKFIPDSDDVMRITTSTQSVPANQPQTIVIRYVPPGNGQVNVIPIDSGGVPIQEGANSGKSPSEIGYVLPADPTKADYVEGGPNARTNLAVIQLTPEEQRKLNQQGELFLSYEGATADEFRLYCQAVLTGTIDRNSDACGLNATEVDSFSDGDIRNMTIDTPSSKFTGELSKQKDAIYGLNPNIPESVDVTVEVTNTGAETIENEPINIFKNSEVEANVESDTDQVIGWNPSPGDTQTETLTLDRQFDGEDVFLRTDMDTGDGTLIVTASNNKGETEEFIYDGHQGLIEERLDGLSASDTWTVTIESEMATGQQAPEVNSVSIQGKSVQGGEYTKEVTLGPGQTTTVTWNDVPTTNTKADQQVTYTAHFYDSTSEVTAHTNVSGCDRTSDTIQCPEPESIITGPTKIVKQQSGSELVREGTQTVQDTECPDGSGDTCGASSDWTLVEENVGTASGTQSMTTTESSVPINKSLTGTSVYDGNLAPLDRGGIQYPYKNLPGDDSEWTIEGYTTKDIVDSEEMVRTKSQMADMYGSVNNAYQAGWTISTKNVRTTVADTEYDYFRVLKSGTAVNEGGSEIDVTSSDWTRVTREQYSHSNINKPLIKTKTTDVDTVIQQNNPGEESLDEDPEDWEKRERVEKVVNRSYDEGVIEEWFHSSPGGDWEFNDSDPLMCYTSNDGCRYTKPAIEEEYWTYEWVKVQEREYQLHKKPVQENVHKWTRNYYEVDVEWSRSLSGTVNEYDGPKYSENTNYDSASGVWHGKRSTPSVTGAEIVDYEWTVNGEVQDQQEKEYSFSSGEITVISQNAIDFSETFDFTLANYEENQNFTVKDYHSDDVRYQPFELALNLDVDDRNEGSLQVRITNDKGMTKVHRIVGEDIPNDGQLSYNLAADSGFNMHSEYYKVNISGTAGAGETVPAVNTVELVGKASRGTDTLSIDTKQTGETTIGLKVTDSQGLTDKTTRTVSIEQCKGSRMCSPEDRDGDGNPEGESPGAYPSVKVVDQSYRADYKLQGEQASVTAEVANLGDGTYVVELVPGDISIDPSSNNLCPGSETMTGNEIRRRYADWGGVEEENLEGDVTYCVSSSGSLADPDATGTSVTVTEAIQEDETVSKVVWEGSQTAGNAETISFTINPRANSQIVMGDEDFKLKLRQVGSEHVIDSEDFNVFFCHALNGNPDTRNTPPEERETRETNPGEAFICPNFNSDFDNFDEDVTVGTKSFVEDDPATDSVDACPYDPQRQTFKYADEASDDYSCKGLITEEFSIEFSNFDNTADVDESSRHIVYYDRYDAVGMDTPYSPTEYTLRLGYSPKYDDAFKNDHLLAYYPLDESAFYMSGLPSVESKGTTTAWTGDEVTSGDDMQVYDISESLSAGKPVVASPAWSLRQTDRTDIDATYPYENVWLAADLSGNLNHAPIVHSQTQVQTESSTVTRAGTLGGDYEYFWRGDAEKMLERGADGPYGGGAYKMEGESFFVPFKQDSKRYYDHFEGQGWDQYDDCENNKCWLPRTNKGQSPIGGPGWNQQMASDLKGSDEFTISLYVKPGQNTGDGSGRNAWLQGRLNRTAFYEFQSWNGHQFGILKDGKKKSIHTAYATGSFYGDAPQYNNINLWNYDKDTGGTYMTVGVPNHSGYAWPKLPSMIANTDDSQDGRTPLAPEYTGYTWGDKWVKQKAAAMSQGYKTLESPPRLKSLRATDHTTIMSNSNTGVGTGWRHLVITGDTNSKMVYYVDGLPYRANLSTGTIVNQNLSSTDYGSGKASFGGFRGSNIIHTVGAEVTKGTTGNYLQDWYISDYRIYDTKMSQQQVNERLVIDEGRYNSTSKNVRNNEKIEFGMESATMDGLLRDVNTSEMTISVDGELNGGAITVKAYPVDDNGDRIDNGNKYLRLHYNETQSVNNTEFFEGGDGVTVKSSTAFDDNEMSKADTYCAMEKMTCTDTSPDKLKINSYNTLPDFVGQDVLNALDNGTINPTTAYRILKYYDDNQKYLLDKRNFWESSIHYSGGTETSMDMMYYNVSTNEVESLGGGDSVKQGITSVNRFEEAVGFNKTLIEERNNTLELANDSQMYDEWEIVVTIEKRPHSQEGPEVDAVYIESYNRSDSVGDSCNPDIYRCDDE